MAGVRLVGTPAMMRQLAALAVQAEEEACWQAHSATVAAEREGVA